MDAANFFKPSDAHSATSTTRNRGDEPFRLQFVFWLQPSHPDHQNIINLIDYLKAKRLFSSYIRDGLRLMHSLSRGDLSVLLELFPVIEELLNVEVERRLAEQSAPPHDALFARLDRLERMLVTASSQQIPAPANPRPAPPPAATGDVDLEVKRAKADADNNPTYNFMIASALQVYGTCDALPDAVISYGLRTKRISAKQVTRRVASEQRKATGNPKAMDVPEVAAPDFDDLEIDL